ncbi:hypothetical protein ACVW17_002862 [Bradyrhizobium sp. USDA 4473]
MAAEFVSQLGAPMSIHSARTYFAGMDDIVNGKGFSLTEGRLQRRELFLQFDTLRHRIISEVDYDTQSPAGGRISRTPWRNVFTLAAMISSTGLASGIP